MWVLHPLRFIFSSHQTKCNMTTTSGQGEPVSLMSWLISLSLTHCVHLPPSLSLLSHVDWQSKTHTRSIFLDRVRANTIDIVWFSSRRLVLVCVCHWMSFHVSLSLVGFTRIVEHHLRAAFIENILACILAALMFTRLQLYRLSLSLSV